MKSINQKISKVNIYKSFVMSTTTSQIRFKMKTSCFILVLIIRWHVTLQVYPRFIFFDSIDTKQALIWECRRGTAQQYKEWRNLIRKWYYFFLGTNHHIRLIGKCSLLYRAFNMMLRLVQVIWFFRARTAKATKMTKWVGCLKSLFADALINLIFLERNFSAYL